MAPGKSLRDCIVQDINVIDYCIREWLGEKAEIIKIQADGLNVDELLELNQEQTLEEKFREHDDNNVFMWKDYVKIARQHFIDNPGELEWYT